MKLLTLILLTTLAMGQDTTKGSFGIGRSYMLMDVTVWTESRAKIVYSRDSNGIFIFHKDVIDEIIAENWKLESANDSLKQENTKLKFLYKEALRLARQYRKEKKYSIQEIDDLRSVCETRWLFGTTYSTGESRISRTYIEQEKNDAVEKMVRTFMLAGKTAEDIRKEDEQKAVRKQIKKGE